MTTLLDVEPNAQAIRAVFLDFDGVLMPQPPRAGFEAFVWLPVLTALIRPHPDVRLVLHTSWRWHQSLEHLSSQLYELSPIVVGMTGKGPRYASILEWLARNPVRSYVILDDQASEFPTPAPSELILCSGRLGITDPAAHARLAVWLGASQEGL